MKIVIALQAAAFTTADFSFDVLGAESEGMIGYLLEPAHKTAYIGALTDAPLILRHQAGTAVIP
jgi:carbamate kinase